MNQILKMQPTDTNLDAVIDWRRGAVQRQEYKPLGLLTQVNLMPAAGVNYGTLNPKQVQSTMLDWYLKTGTLLGLADGSGDVLVIGPLAPPPPLPDPTYIGGNRKRKTPMVPQHLEERACGKLMVKKETWLVFQPVNQILFKAHEDAAWGLVKCSPDRNGKSTAMLYNQQRREAHFVFGQKEIKFR